MGAAVAGRLVPRFLVDRFLAPFLAPFFLVDRFFADFLAPFFLVARFLVDFLAAFLFFAIECGSFRCSARHAKASIHRGADNRGETSNENNRHCLRTAASSGDCRQLRVHSLQLSDPSINSDVAELARILISSDEGSEVLRLQLQHSSAPCDDACAH